MSDFSNKCREYLKDTGENVYQLSASSGLDRTSLQRMITGKRLPGIDFVRQFCDSLRINPSQRRELMELYKHLLDTDMGHEKCRILKPSVLPETGIHLEVLSDYSVFLCFLSEKDTFLCIYLKETSIGQALNDYLCSLSEEESVYTKKEARQILLGLLEQL